MSGTTPPGAETERQAAAWVRDMFGQVAPRYDLLNHVLSFNIDRLWRARTVERVRPILEQPGARIIDLCCGTGDMVLSLQSATRNPVWGSDFCHPMLQAAHRKSQSKGRSPSFFESDALQLPMANGSADLVTIAFGFRNLANYESGLTELRRVLRPGGLLAILEFSQPPNGMLRALYNTYSNHFLPTIGGLLSGAPAAYTYLPESVKKFPGAERLADLIRQAGFSSVEFERLTFGVVALHLCRA